MDETLTETLENAKLVAAHGARAGAFAADEPLFAAITAAEGNAAALTWASMETAELQAALNRAVQKISPVTLYDLRDGWRPHRDFPWWRPRRYTRGLAKLLVLAATIIVLVLCGWMTIWQKQADGLISGLAKNNIEQQNHAINELVVMMSPTGNESATEINDIGSALRFTMREKWQEIVALEVAILADVKEYERLREQDPFALTSRWIDENSDKLFTHLGMPEVISLLPDSEAPAADPVVNTNAAVLGIPAEKQQLFHACGSPTNEVQDPVYVSSSGQVDDLPAVVREVLRADLNYIRKIKCDLDFPTLSQSMDLEPNISAQNQALNLQEVIYKVDIFKIWLLPMLYGMLGALIYHMRIYLSNLRPDPSLMKVVLRVFLGGFAGITIGWFGLPSDSEAFGLTGVKLTALAFAFIVGFSVDVFLNLLDRIVTLLNAWVSGIGVAAKSG